jgi:hypothetical protein
MKTEDLIADLAGRLTPARPLPSPGIRALSWCVLAGACASAGVTLFGARADVMVRLTEFDYLWSTMLALIASMFAVVLTLVLAIPGVERTPLFRLSSLGVLILWTLTMLWAVVTAGRGLPVTADPHWPVCFMRVVLIGLIPALVLFVMVRRGMPLRLGWTAAFAAIAATSIGALAVQITCPLDDAGHAFLGHFVPVMAMAAAGVAARGTLAGKTAV